DVVFLTTAFGVDGGLQLGIEVGDGQIGGEHGHSGNGSADSTGTAPSADGAGAFCRMRGTSCRAPPEKTARSLYRDPAVSLAPLLALQEALHDARPGPCQVLAVVATTAHPQDTSVTELVGQHAQADRGMRVRL